MFDPTCDFCKIARGDSPAEVILESEFFLAFFPLNPATPGHTLVVPKDHVENLWAATTTLARDLMHGVLQVGQAVKEVLSPHGMNLITSAGTIAEQTVFHLHLHVVPRWRDDKFGLIWPTGERFEVEDLDDLATRLRERLAE